MSDEHTPGLPDDWKPPEQVLLNRAWEEHPRHEELAALVQERDAHGYPKWKTRREPHPDHPDWTVVWFQPANPDVDTRESIQITEYPNEWLEREYARVRAIIEEHHLD